VKKQYEKIKELKIIHESFSKIDYLGVNLWNIMAPSIYHWYENKYIRKNYFPEPNFKRMFGFLLTKESFKISNRKPGKILTSFFIPSENKHSKLHLQFVKSFSSREMMKIYNKDKKISTGNIFDILYLLKRVNKKKLIDIFGSKKEFIYFILFAYYNLKQIKTLSRIVENIDPNGYLAFNCSGNRDESILTQLIANKNKVTFNLQHGTFSVLNDFSTAYLIYENMISDYQFSWGKSSTEIIKKYVSIKDFKKSILYSGNPNYYDMKEKGKNYLKKGVFFLSGEIFKDENQKVLDILESFLKNNRSVKISLKSHPGDSLDNYSFNKKLFISIRENLEVENILNESDFMIGYNTTVLFESLRYGIPVLQFKGKISDLGAYANFESFINLKTFNLKFRKLKNIKLLNSVIKNQKIIYKNVFFQPKVGDVSNNLKKIIFGKII